MIVPEVALIPRKVIFGNPDKAAPRLSPDGTRLSYLAPVKGVLNVWVGPSDDPDAAEPVTSDTTRGIRQYFWAFTNRHIIYLQDKAGDENWRVYSVNLEAGETKDLTPAEGVHATVQSVSKDVPGEIVVGLNDRDPQYHDLHRIDISTGERRLIQRNEEFAAFVTDDDYNVRFAMRLTPDGGGDLLKAAGDGWEPFIEIEADDVLTTQPEGFDKSGRVLYMKDSRKRDTSAMVSIDLDTGELTTLAQDPHADVSDDMVHPTDKNVQAVAFTYERKEWQVLDESIAPDLDYLGTLAEGDVEIVSRTLDDSRWIVAYMMDNGPVRYYRYDRKARSAEFLFTNRSQLEEYPLARMHPVVIKSRDGLDLVCYYSLPVGSDSSGTGRPDTPLPTVLDVHGGPWYRDEWGYSPVHQLLANRGYAALGVNFRGSTGLGKAFTNAGNLEWGRKMHDDLLDAVQWAIDQGIADPQRIAITGGSYGGYAALVGLTATPETFACGVDIVGPSNLITLLESIPPYWEPMLKVFSARVGDHRTDDGKALLTERSPLTRVDHISKPLLIGQGANDPRVKQAESDQIVKAMQDKDIPVTYVLYPDEGHGFARPENALSFSAVTEAFLAQHLGGRFEPVGDGFEGSSITVPTGAEHVPGLEEGLGTGG